MKNSDLWFLPRSLIFLYFSPLIFLIRSTHARSFYHHRLFRIPRRKSVKICPKSAAFENPETRDPLIYKALSDFLWNFRGILPARGEKARENFIKTKEKKGFRQTSEAPKHSVFRGKIAFYLFFCDSSTATATATVAPTIGLLPIPIRPIIST